MLITTTGYYATGSSAIYDLLKEYDSCSVGKIKFGGEQVILYTPNGLFDMEDKLLIGNNIHRSDEAFESFKAEMLRLYKNNFGWFGNFKNLFGEKFLEIVDEFIDSLVEYRLDGSWSYDYKTTKFSLKAFLKDIKNIIEKKPLKNDLGKRAVFGKDTLRYSYPTSEKFYGLAKKFINDYFSLIVTEPDKNLILDHFLLPHNLYRLPNYFNEDEVTVFVVERDPRDVFIENLNYLDRGVVPRIPTDVDPFISFWRDLRRCEKVVEANNIIRIHFEDLIYNYDAMVKMIEEKCGLSSNEHNGIKKYFNPQVSIKNTKLYVENTKYSSEIDKISVELKEYLYQY